MDLTIFQNKYEDINVDLFKLKLPNFNEILSDILQKDNLDKYIQLHFELKLYRQFYDWGGDTPAQVYWSPNLYNNYDELLSKDQLIIEKQIVSKRIKRKYKWLILQNLKSETCKIIRFIIVNKSIDHRFTQILYKLKKKFTEKQQLLISDIIRHKYENSSNIPKYQSKLIIEPYIKKTYNMDNEILEKLVYSKEKTLDLLKELHDNGYDGVSYEYTILNNCKDIIKLPVTLNTIYLDSIIELFVIHVLTKF